MDAEFGGEADVGKIYRTPIPDLGNSRMLRLKRDLALNNGLSQTLMRINIPRNGRRDIGPVLP